MLSGKVMASITLNSGEVLFGRLIINKYNDNGESITEVVVDSEGTGTKGTTNIVDAEDVLYLSFNPS